MLSKSLKRAQN